MLILNRLVICIRFCCWSAVSFPRTRLSLARICVDNGPKLGVTRDGRRCLFFAIWNYFCRTCDLLRDGIKMLHLNLRGKWMRLWCALSYTLVHIALIYAWTMPHVFFFVLKALLRGTIIYVTSQNRLSNHDRDTIVRGSFFHRFSGLLEIFLCWRMMPSMDVSWPLGGTVLLLCLRRRKLCFCGGHCYFSLVGIISAQRRRAIVCYVYKWLITVLWINWTAFDEWYLQVLVRDFGGTCCRASHWELLVNIELELSNKLLVAQIREHSATSAATLRVRVIECDMRDHFCISVLEQGQCCVFFHLLISTSLWGRYVIKTCLQQAFGRNRWAIARRVWFRTFLLTFTVLHYFNDCKNLHKKLVLTTRKSENFIQQNFNKIYESLNI